MNHDAVSKYVERLDKAIATLRDINSESPENIIPDSMFDDIYSVIAALEVMQVEM